MSLTKSKTLKNILTGFGFVAIILTFMPFIAVDYWWVRMFDYPHLQLTLLTAIAIITYFITFNFKEYRDYIFITVLIACFIIQSIKIYPYTAFASHEVNDATTNSNKTFSIYTANVLQKNKETSHLISQIKSIDPDIVLLTEVDGIWQNAVDRGIANKYQYKLSHPIDNTYGISFYSKLPLVDGEIKFLVSDSIPSVHTKIKMPSGELLQLYGIHPTPPMPQENPKSTDRDAEMMEIAKMCLDSDMPIIVIGDFNDVAWSETTRLFENVSELLDARRGRGLFNTFNAKNFIMRWPLDHIFVSEHFRILELNTGADINSDHFPFYAELSFEPKKASEQMPESATKEEIKEAEKEINKERKEPK